LELRDSHSRRFLAAALQKAKLGNPCASVRCWPVAKVTIVYSVAASISEPEHDSSSRAAPVSDAFIMVLLARGQVQRSASFSGFNFLRPRFQSYGSPLELLQESGITGDILFEDIIALYHKLLPTIGWAPRPWNPVARELKKLLGGKKTYVLWLFHEVSIKDKHTHRIALA
jgi:hypothetical protein